MTSGRSPDRRRALLDAADRAILRDGHEVSMAAIAAEAGITKPILYRHFGDRSGLYEALADRHVRTVLALLRPELTRRDASLGERTRAAIDVYLTLISAHRPLYRFLFHRAGAEDPRTRTHVTALVRGLGEELAAVLSADGVVPDAVRAQILGHAVVGMVQTTGDWWLDHQDVPAEAVATTLTAAILAALRPHPG